MTDVIRTLDADGSEVYVFTEVAGGFGEYPESSKVINNLSHSARAPYTESNFRHRTLQDEARFVYSILDHSSNCCHSRTMSRNLSIRSASPSCDDLHDLE